MTWDQQVAAMIAWLQTNNLRLHIGRNGNVMFSRKVRR